MKRLMKHFAVLAMLMLVVAPVVVNAQANVDKFFDNRTGNLQNATGLGNSDPLDVATGIINVMMGFLGIIAVVIILFGGFKWMTAAGSEDKISEAKKMITAGIIGLAIILSAWGITIFVLGKLLTVTNGA